MNERVDKYILAACRRQARSGANRGACIRFWVRLPALLWQAGVAYICGLTEAHVSVSWCTAASRRRSAFCGAAKLQPAWNTLGCCLAYRRPVWHARVAFAGAYSPLQLGGGEFFFVVSTGLLWFNVCACNGQFRAATLGLGALLCNTSWLTGWLGACLLACRAYGVWASSGEIDIMEARGQPRLNDTLEGTLHFGERKKGFFLVYFSQLRVCLMHTVAAGMCVCV